MSDKILDLLRGELNAADAARVEARIASDPRLAAERARWASLLVAAQAAHATSVDEAAGARVAARVLDRVRREEERAEREARRGVRATPRVLWARILAVSVATHVLALGVLAATRGEGVSPSGRDDDTRGARGADGLSVSVRPGEEADPYYPIPAGVGSLEVDRPDDRVAMERLVETLAPVPPDPIAHPSVHPIESDVGGMELLPPVGDSRFSPFHPNVRRIMRTRTTDVEKQRLLRLSGVDADGTMRGVRYGLEYLAEAQDDRDGSFPPAAGRSAVWSTSIAILPFLGEGHGSRIGARKDVVDRAIGWLRSHAASAREPADLGVALVALAEDFMLSSGALTPSENERRRREMSDVATALANVVPAGGTPELDAATPLWTSMGLASAARVGVPTGASGVKASDPAHGNPAWVALATASPSDAASAAADPRKALLEGVALLWSAGDKAQASRFPSWNAGVGRALLARMQRYGGVTVPPGTPAPARAEQTALVLLGLQLAYRTY